MTKKKTGFWRLYRILAVTLFALAAVGLTWFWFFMDAYEQSRPQTAVEGYLLTAAAERICTLDTEVLASYDRRLQSEEAALQAIRGSIGPLTCLRDGKRSTDTKLVYAVMNGGRRIGSVTMTPSHRDLFGFDHWQVSGEEYDFSHLLGNAVSVTVPEDYRVYADSSLLDSRFVTDSGIPFRRMEDFSEKYSAPTLKTYSAGPIFGTVMLSATTPQGDPVDIGDQSAIQDGYRNYTEEEQTSLDKFMTGFVNAYVRFSSGRGGNGNRYYNYYNLSLHLVPDGELKTRMKDAINGMTWVMDRGTEVVGLETNQYIRLDGGAYLCDVTYTVTRKLSSGQDTSSVNIRVIVVKTDGGLKAEAMTIY